MTADNVAGGLTNTIGRSFVLAMAGAALGCGVVVFSCLITGIALLLLTPYGLVLMVAVLLAVCLTTVGARAWPGRLNNRIIMLVSAVLTIMLFIAFPIYLIVQNWDRGVAGPMFG